MPTGTAWTPDGTIGLWDMNFKINGPYRGFNLKFHIAEVDEATAITAAGEVGAKMLCILPGDAEIVYATVAKTDNRRDSRFVPGCLGVGKHLLSAGPDVPATCNHERDALRVRFESAGPGPVVRLFPLIPDDQVEAQLLANPVAPITAIPGALPTTPIAFLDWAANFNTFLGTIVYLCHHVLVHDTPGGVYTYYAWKKAYPGALSTKKGGRDFI